VTTTGRGEAKRLLAQAEADARRIDKRDALWARCLALLLRAGVSSCRGDASRAVTQLRETVARCDEAEMHLHAAAARIRLGEALGGDEGRAAIERGTKLMTSEGVRAPDRVTEMLAPGFRG